MTKYVNNNGVSEMWLNIKNWVTSQLLGYSQTGHTHTKSQITDLDLSNFVDKTSNQTISGPKTFTSVPSVKKDSAGDLLYLIDDTINTSNEDENGFPLTGHTNSLKIRGHDGNMLPCMLTAQVFTNGDTSAELRAYKYKDISSPNSRAILSLRYIYNNNYGIATFSNVSFITPNVTNTTNLGSSALQWNSAYTRHIHIDNDINIWSSTINKTSNSGSLSLRGGTNYADGASIGLYGKDYNSTIAGVATITAYGNFDYTIFYLYPNGTMSVYNNSTNTTKNLAMQEDVNTLLNGKANSSHTHTKSEITDFPTIPTKTSDLTNDSGFLTSHQDLSGYVPRSGGAVMTGSLLASPTTSEIGFGYGWGNGGTIYTYSPTHSTVDWQGTIRLEPLKTTSNFKTMQLAPGGTWTWNGSAVQITSDQRLKQQITEIDDKLLDAWEDVELVQFKYNESVDTKGKSARLHTGYVVQQIDKACQSHGVDITQYGLFCHEEYPEETKEIEVVQKDGTKTKETKVIREANEHYSLRYTEALIVECKYLRRCIARLTARIEELEKGNNIK